MKLYGTEIYIGESLRGYLFVEAENPQQAMEKSMFMTTSQLLANVRNLEYIEGTPHVNVGWGNFTEVKLEISPR